MLIETEDSHAVQKAKPCGRWMLFASQTVACFSQTIAFFSQTIVFYSQTIAFFSHTIAFFSHTIAFFSHKIAFISQTIAFLSQTIAFFSRNWEGGMERCNIEKILNDREEGQRHCFHTMVATES